MALALRPSDPALLHYRSGAFYLARAGQVGRDGGAATSCSASPPRATSRSRAGGTRCSATTTLAVIPQTSTIASHLPRAVGVAIAIDRARKLGVDARGRPTLSSSAASATPR